MSSILLQYGLDGHKQRLLETMIPMFAFRLGFISHHLSFPDLSVPRCTFMEENNDIYLDYQRLIRRAQPMTSIADLVVYAGGSCAVKFCFL